MINVRYLSCTRDQKEEITQLVAFHRDLLISAAKSGNNTELLANFLAEVYHCNKKLFIDVIISLPET